MVYEAPWAAQPEESSGKTTLKPSLVH